jgi:CubicO group peptidase (beta-lactamase class C family)
MPGLAEAFDRIGASVEHHLPVSHAGGLALAVTDREEILGVVVRGFADVASGAPVRPETRFQIGSISKSFAAIVVMQEVEAGRLDLHVSVNELLPWLELPEPFGPITLHHLLQHTSGLATGTEDAPTGPGALWRLRHLPPTFPPGERSWYSNDGYKIVGAVLERVTGTPIHDLLRERILDPLGMRSTEAAITDAVRTEQATGYLPIFTDRPPQLHHPLAPATWIVSNTADGSIVSNVIDMSAYARMLLDRGAVGTSGERLLSDEAFEALSSGGRDFGDGEPYAYGLWEMNVQGRRWVAHTGGMVGFTALLATSPEEGLACVALQNGLGSRWPLVRHAFSAVRSALAGDAPPEAWSPPPPTSIPGAEAYVGRYVDGDGRALEVATEGDGLRAVLDGIRVEAHRDPLKDEPSDAFALPHPDLERFLLRFGRDEDGAVVEAFHGNAWFRGARYAGEEPEEPPSEWRGRVGLYRSNDPWSPTIRITLRKGRLVIGFPVDAGDEEGEAELIPLDDGSFAAGEPWHPRRVRFEGEIEGRAVAVVFNGGYWYRSFEE